MDPNQWTRVQKRNEKQRKNLSLFVNLSLSLSLCLDSFCLPIAMRSSFVCLLFKHLIFFILVVKGEESRFPKRLSLDETMKQGWSLRWNVAVATIRTMPFAKAIWVILATSELCSPRGPQHVTPNRQASNMNPKETRVLTRLRSYAVRSIRFVTWKNIKIGNRSHDSAWSIVPPSDLPTISVNSTWRSIILLDMSCAQQKGVPGLRFQTLGLGSTMFSNVFPKMKDLADLGSHS